MSGYIIGGGNPLCGAVSVSGGKNAVLPVLSAVLLCSEGKVTLTNCPDITDVKYTLEILKCFGCEVYSLQGQITVDATNVHTAHIPCELTSKLRSASLFLGASLARFGEASQCFSGGCELGERPIDMHLSSFEKMGVEVSCTEESLQCKNHPHTTDIFLPFASVGATENIILAAALSNGITTITNAAREPEITELCTFINAMGGKIKGAGTSLIVIEGVEKLRGINYNIIGDRIEAATFLALAMATDGEITVRGAEPRYLAAFIDTLVNCGGFVCRRENEITVRRSGHFILPSADIITAPYPAFPTDAQSITMAMLTKSTGTTVICERIFSDRLKVAAELVKMGADIKVCGDTAVVRGVPELYGTEVTACDLRSGAALVIAALSAKGESRISNICYLERGYSELVNKLRVLGADITKEE